VVIPVVKGDFAASFRRRETPANIGAARLSGIGAGRGPDTGAALPQRAADILRPLCGRLRRKLREAAPRCCRQPVCIGMRRSLQSACIRRHPDKQTIFWQGPQGNCPAAFLF
jgi:hypothetical protein